MGYGDIGKGGLSPSRLVQGEGCTQFVIHDRSRMAIDSCIPTIPRQRTSSFHRPGRHCLHQARSAVRSHEVRAATYREPLLRRTFLHMDDSVE